MHACAWCMCVEPHGAMAQPWMLYKIKRTKQNVMCFVCSKIQQALYAVPAAIPQEALQSEEWQ